MRWANDGPTSSAASRPAQTRWLSVRTGVSVELFVFPELLGAACQADVQAGLRQRVGGGVFHRAGALAATRSRAAGTGRRGHAAGGFPALVDELVHRRGCLEDDQQ